MQIRAAISADHSAILEMRMALFAETGEVLSAEEREAVLHANDAYFRRPSNGCKSWVAVNEGRIVGVGTLAFFFRPPYPGNLAGKEAYLLNMYTRPENRGCGVAKSIVSQALAYAKMEGVNKVWLHATDAGRPIYEAAGFSPAPSYMERISDA